MSKTVFQIIMAIVLLPASALGQSYASLWKQAETAAGKDLPKTQIGVLKKISAKAETDRNYGQLLRAGLKTVTVMADIAPDSLLPAVERMEQREKTTADAVLKSVFAAVLYRIYNDNPAIADDAAARAADCRKRAMAHPAALAGAKAGGFGPFVVKGYNSKIFNDDMLSVVGYEVGDYETLYKHYHNTGMRKAACMAAIESVRQRGADNAEKLNKSAYANWLDSIINIYSDLDVACEAAIEKYHYMERCDGVTVEEKISYIHYALDKWGGWQGAGELRNAEKALTNPSFGVSIKRNTIEPGVSQTVTLNDLRNINSLTMKVYRVNTDGDTNLNPQSDEDYKKLKPLLSPMAGMWQTQRYMSNPDYQLFSDSLTLAALPAGVYMLEFATSPATETVRCLYYVTDLYLMAEELPAKTIRYVAVSATTGQPVAGAKIRLTTENYSTSQQQTVTLTCDARGEAIYRYISRQPDRCFVFTDKDRYYPGSWTNTSFHYYSNTGQRDITKVFTDRSIYRPGQTVHVGAVVYELSNSVDHTAVAGKTVTALLRDANHKIVAEKRITTDKYGTCAADFTLPTGSLNGNFIVSVNNRRISFRVEEYKRPTFTVEFPKINETYGNGDTLVVRAKALSFAGVPVQGARVKYKVTRRKALWWQPYFNFGATAKTDVHDYNTVLNEKETVTAADGTFAVEMPMTLPESDGKTGMFYNFEAEAYVTDISGETRSGQISVPLGDKRTAFSCDLPDKVLADSLETITFSLRNAAGVDIHADVRFRIDGSDRWQTAKTTVPFCLGTTLASGRHRLMAVCESDTINREFVAFGLDDKVPCVDTRDWFYVSDNTFPADGRPVTVQVGSSDSDVHIVYTILSGTNVLESGVIDHSNAIDNRKLTYKEMYGDGLRLNFAWVKNGLCHTHTATIRRPLPDKRLTMKWTSFRDRLTPGQKEEWRMSVTMPDGSPAKAQLMATLYDKSLDQIAGHSWTFSPSPVLNLPSSRWEHPRLTGVSMYGAQRWTAPVFKAFGVSHFDDSLFPSGRLMFNTETVARPMASAGMRIGGTRMMAQSKAGNNIFDFTEAKVATAESAEDKSDAPTDGNIAGTDGQVRENLNETAFFFPALEAGADGSVTLRFTLPESLTTWRFMGFAHTADMHAGMIEAEAVAKKEVMIQPNVPRFVRTGDHAKIAARIFNTGERRANGTARIELTDPETGSTVCSQSIPFAVEAGATGSVTFDYSPDGNHPLLICRMTAEGKTFSDGEQHYLPVLPDRERVTVTVPFSLNKPGTKSVSMAGLLPADGVQNKLTIEYTNNPAWLMVQALPAVGSPHDNNVIDQCAAFYANALAQAVIGSNPEIKTVFDRWRMERPETASLTGSLTRNEELKDIVMNETPWVADAERETEQKQRMADFFDASLMQNRKDAATAKLLNLQNADGSWSWWPGMKGNLPMTVETAEMLVRLNAMTGKQEATKGMLDKAMGYIGKQMVKEVEAMKKRERDGKQQVWPGMTALRYLYLCAIDGRKLSAGQLSANDYLIALLKKDIKGQTIYAKALSAVVLAKHGEATKSAEYTKSLKEYTVYNEETGRYYDTPRAEYSWRDYRIPTEVAALEAIRMITPEDSLTAEEMKRWLLQEKRTQAWDTPVNSVNAIYAFFDGNANLTTTQAKASFAIDGKTVEQPAATAGLGYVKMVVGDTKGKTLTVNKTSQGTSWGAIYAQSLQKTSEVEASASGMSIKREIVSNSKQLKVGDRVKVRITIVAERDFDFVQVADRRAACMEPVGQLSGYRGNAYCSPKDNATNYYFYRMAKGKHVVETEYYVDRAGRYETGTCSVSCAYAPEYRATAKSETIDVNE